MVTSLRLVVPLAVLVGFAAACSSDAQPTELTSQAPATTVSAATTSEAGDDQDDVDPTEISTTSTSTTASTGGSAGTQPDPRPDLLTFPRGALFVSQTGLGSGSSGSALRIIDGDPRILVVSNDGREPTVLVYSLPVATTFERFAIPGITDRPGNTTFFRDILIEGSADGPDAGFEVVVDAELTIPDDEDAVTELIPEALLPVRWLRVTLSDGIVVVEGQEGRTNLEFTELIGNGVQEPQPLSTVFDGRWEFRLTERVDIRADVLELRQVGATIVGCFGDIDLQGSVNGSIATATGINRVNGKPSAFIFVEDPSGVIQAAASIDGSIFGARTAVVVPDLEPTGCADEAEAPLACGATIYVNFDLDSAIIRPESDQVLADLYERLREEGGTSVSIEGHTSTEGSDEYNLDLSERRARAVVDDLVARGFEAEVVAAIGHGEERPLVSPDNDETSRAINRRVEIVCG